MSSTPPRVTLLYHYFHPDDVVSARHFSDLAEDLTARGWQVEAMPANRGCRDESRVYPLRETWRGIDIRRVWRPNFTQVTSSGRLLNAAWVIGSWCTIALRPGSKLPDVLVVGTEPVLSVAMAAVVRALRPSVKIAHWCFDMYPEGAIAEGMLREDSLGIRALKRVLGRAYASCDVIADIGSCMRERIREYGGAARAITLVPWALVEPSKPSAPDAETRHELFGDAKLGLLYSGNFGRAHSHESILSLARKMRGDDVRFSFGIRGNRADRVREAVTEADTNVTFAGFAPENALEKRLSAADIHLVSLRDEWTGVVVPSKFFGSLAAGRPVIFAGSPKSAIAGWIREHKVGWLLTEETTDDVAAELRALAAESGRLAALQAHCHAVYEAHFARARMTAAWDRELRAVLDPSAVREARAESPLRHAAPPRVEARTAASARSNGIARHAPAARKVTP